MFVTNIFQKKYNFNIFLHIFNDLQDIFTILCEKIIFFVLFINNIINYNVTIVIINICINHTFFVLLIYMLEFKLCYLKTNNNKAIIIV